MQPVSQSPRETDPADPASAAPGDLGPAEFRAAAARAVEIVALYLDDPAVWPVLPPTPPGFPSDLAMSPDGGVLFVGSRGLLIHETYGEKPVLVGDGTAARAARIPQTLPRIAGGLRGHEQNWIRAIRGEEPASCPFDYAVPLNETMILGVVALKAGQAIAWDAAAGRVTNAPEANAYLGRVYRKGWEL